MRFISDISLWWLLPIAIIAAGLTYLFYARQNWLKEVKGRVRKLLYLLRFLSLLLIGLLLLGILFETVQTRMEKPVFITLIDNSSSLKNYKDSAEVLASIEGFRKEVQDKYGDRFEWKTFLTGDRFRAAGAVGLNDGTSNLSQGFEEIYSQYYNRNVGGIVFISDGNFNQGQSPVYSAEKIALTPVFTLGVGDTSAKKDQLIRDVSTNEIAFLKNKFPVEIDIEAIKMGKTSSRVSILHKGKTIASQLVNYTNGEFDYKHLSFELDAEEIGFQHYVVEVSPLSGEYTSKNNYRSFYIEVLDGRNKVLLLAGAPHPDIAALKYVLQKDENITVESQVITDWDKKLDKVDLIIWHEPGLQLNTFLLETIQQSGKPILYFIGPNTQNNVIQRLDIGMTVRSSFQLDEVQTAVNSGFELFEISSGVKDALRFYPPVKIRYGEVKLSPQNKVFLNQRIGEIQKQEPVFFFGEREGRKYGVFYGEGIWKWKLNEYSRTGSTENFEELIQKINQYLVVKQNSSSLRVTMPKRFPKTDEIRIKAEFYNDAMELITSPVIKLKVKDEQGKSSLFDFGTSGNFYQLNIGTLAPGRYEWSASTEHNGKKYAKSGVFVVEDIDIEQIETSADHTVLRQISENSNGSFYPLSTYKQLISELDKRDDLVEVAYQESSFRNLLDDWWILLLIAALLGAEWFLRRWNGAY